MSQEQGFLSAIAENREDTTARLVYADWLEENGQPGRADCLRYEVWAAERIGWCNVISILDVEKHYEMRHDDEAIVSIMSRTFSEERLREAGQSHVLLPGQHINLLGIIERHKNLIARSDDLIRDLDPDEETARYYYEPHLEPRWYLIRREGFPDSQNLPYEQQVALLSENEEVPNAVHIMYLMTLSSLATNKRLPLAHYMYCCDEILERGIGPMAFQAIMPGFAACTCHSYIGLESIDSIGIAHSDAVDRDMHIASMLKF